MAVASMALMARPSDSYEAQVNSDGTEDLR